MVGVQLVPTSAGTARVTIDAAEQPRALLALGHGAGGGVKAPDLAARATALPGRGFTVVRVEQPYVVAGKRAGPRPEALDTAWREVIAALPEVMRGTLRRKRAREGAPTADLSPEGHPLAVGGRSAGARVACRTAKDSGAVAVVALAFPLHLPGRPDRSRADELLGAGVPTLVMQGSRDPFGRPAEFPPGDYILKTIDEADHSFAVPRGSQPGRSHRLKVMAEAVADWLDSVLALGSPR